MSAFPDVFSSKNHFDLSFGFPTGIFDYLLSFPKSCLILNELAKFSTIFDLPLSLILSSSDRRFLLQFHHVDDFDNFLYTNGLFFMDLHTLVLQMLELFNEINQIRSVLIHHATLFGLAYTLNLYLLSLVPQIYSDKCTLVNFLRKRLILDDDDNPYIVLSHHHESLFNYQNFKVTSSFKDLMEIYVCIFSNHSQLLSPKNNYSIGSCFSKMESLLNQNMSSYLYYLIILLLIKKTAQIPIDMYCSDSSNTYNQLISDHKFHSHNSYTRFLQSETNMIHHIRNISSCNLILSQMSKYRNLINSCIHYFMNSYSQESNHILRIFSSSLLLSDSESIPRPDFHRLFMFNLRKEFSPCINYIKTLNLDLSYCLRNTHKNMLIYLNIFHFIESLVQSLYACNVNSLNRLCSIYSIFPTENLQLEFNFNSSHNLTKLVQIYSPYSFSLHRYTEICCEFGSVLKSNSIAFDFQTLFIFLFMILTLNSQRSFNEELYCIAHLYQSILPNYSFCRLIHFKPIQELTGICDIIDSGVLLSTESFSKCLKLNYNIKILQNSDGLILY